MDYQENVIDTQPHCSICAEGFDVIKNEHPAQDDFLLRLVEIIGEDQIDSLGTETLYFIIAVLNETNLDNLRNKIIIKTLPNRV